MGRTGYIERPYDAVARASVGWIRIEFPNLGSVINVGFESRRLEAEAAAESITTTELLSFDRVISEGRTYQIWEGDHGKGRLRDHRNVASCIVGRPISVLYNNG